LRAARGNGFGDNSNTQFGVLGLWAAGRAGVDVRDAMADVDRRFRGTASPQGGWGYNAPHGESPAMTCAGVMALVLAKGHATLADAQMANQRDKSKKSPDTKKLVMDSDPVIDRGLQRAAAYAQLVDGFGDYYFLWSVERLGVALGGNHIGAVAWYDRGAPAVVRAQSINGSWQGRWGTLADTSFALLFLRRSNLTEGLPQLVGRGTSQEGNSMRAGTLQDLVRTLKEPKDRPEPAEKPAKP
jgi:hypothetical protein